MFGIFIVMTRLYTPVREWGYFDTINDFGLYSKNGVTEFKTEIEKKYPESDFI